MTRLLPAVLLIALTALPAHASDRTTLQNIKGNVLVNQGVAYNPAFEGMPLRQGDRILTLRDGYATISYSDNCDRELEPSTLEQVGTEASCLAGAIVQKDPRVLGVKAETVEGLTAGVISGGLIYLLKDSRDDDDFRPLSP